jgi:hypothetical protein
LAESDSDEAYVVSSQMRRYIDGCSASGLALLSHETPARDLESDASDEEHEVLLFVIHHHYLLLLLFIRIKIL